MLILILSIVAAAFIVFCVWQRNNKLAFYLICLATIALFINASLQPSGESLVKQKIKQIGEPSAQEKNLTEPYRNSAEHLIYGPAGKKSLPSTTNKQTNWLWWGLFLISFSGLFSATVFKITEKICQQAKNSGQSLKDYLQNYLKQRQEKKSLDQQQSFPTPTTQQPPVQQPVIQQPTIQQPAQQADTGFPKLVLAGLTTEALWDFIKPVLKYLLGKISNRLANLLP